jgi:hypothetical protein
MLTVLNWTLSETILEFWVYNATNMEIFNLSRAQFSVWGHLPALIASDFKKTYVSYIMYCSFENEYIHRKNELALS